MGGGFIGRKYILGLRGPATEPFNMYTFVFLVNLKCAVFTAMIPMCSVYCFMYSA